MIGSVYIYTYIIAQLAVYTAYIPGLYCPLAGYNIFLATSSRKQNNPLILRRKPQTMKKCHQRITMNLVMSDLHYVLPKETRNFTGNTSLERSFQNWKNWRLILDCCCKNHVQAVCYTLPQDSDPSQQANFIQDIFIIIEGSCLKQSATNLLSASK